MEHFAFNCNSHQPNPAWSELMIRHTAMSVEVIKIRTKILWCWCLIWIFPLLNCQFSRYIWVQCVAEATAHDPTTYQFDYAKSMTFVHAENVWKSKRCEFRMWLLRGSVIGEWCQRATRWMKEREPYATCNKAKDKEGRQFGYARNFLLITVWNPWQFIR